tara:strand:+ start:1039 stop:1452 length:414 start_codon:yes stop_codon:yes gene_type:complete
MRKVLILCTGNSCRSQMAEALLSYFSKNTKVYSAGTKPEKINSYAIKAMAEIGIDISRNTSNNANEYANIYFDYVFTVCDNAKEICPIYPKAKQMIHHSFADPADATGTDSEQLAVYLDVRDQLSDYFKDFAEKKLH